MNRLRALLQQDGMLRLPGIYDGISLRVAESMGFPALYMTGYGTVGSHLAVPDAGIASYADMLSRVQVLCGATDLPVLCDGDTGYGGLLNVAHTVAGYEKAGAAGIQLEDQEMPKKCGHTPGRQVIALQDMVRKIRVAREARSSDAGIVIVARTDARTNHGLDEALRRAEAYLNAGADVLFVESPESEDELRRIGDAFRGTPLLVNNVEGGKTPILPPAALAAMGFKIAIYPALGFLAAGHAMRQAYGKVLHEDRFEQTDVVLDDFSAFSKMMGFEQVWDFEQRHG